MNVANSHRIPLSNEAQVDYIQGRKCDNCVVIETVLIVNHDTRFLVS